MDQGKEASVTRAPQDTPHASRVPAVKSRLVLPVVPIGILLVLVADIWFISFGTWTHWPQAPRADYYDQLARAFAHGSVALERQVDPAVLALANPYSGAGRQGVSIPMDFTLYKGKYYLYFGPAPALPLTLLKLLGTGQIGDQFLVFAFIAGIAVFQALFLIKIRRLFFPGRPDWLLAMSIVFSGLVCPFAWILTEARVYEAALTAGQFFFLAGGYFVLTALTRDSGRPTGFLLLAGAAWALAIGSRLTQGVPIGLLCLLIGFGLIWIHFRSGSWSKALRPLIALGLPIAAGIVLLGWYNWARFGSVFETGFKYQITAINFLKHNRIFSTLYVLPNAYDYLVARPKINGQFPFLQPVRGHGELRFAFLDLPGIYRTRAVTGFLVSVPFVVFGALSVLATRPLKRLSGVSTQQAADTSALSWIVLGLWVAFLSGLAVILSYFWVEGRFLLDFTPALVLLSVLGFFLGYQALDRRPLWRRIYLAGALALMLASIMVSNLLAYSMHSSAYQINNPALWQWLAGLSAR